MNETQLVETLRTRLIALYAASMQGDDVAPGDALRTEGLLEAAALLGILSETKLVDLVAVCYREAYGRALEDDFGEHWRTFFPFPQIPLMGRRAPVVPTTRET